MRSPSPLWAVGLGCGAFFGGLLTPTFAGADCARPQPKLLWSYPADGDTSVPTNVDLWVLTAGWGQEVSARLGEVELPRLDMPHGFELGELAPDTQYTLSVALRPELEEGERVALTFTTGSGPSDPDPGAAPGEVGVRRESEVSLSRLCDEVLWTQDCFDTGQNTHFVFAPAGTAKGWLIESPTTLNRIDVWPAECGSPELFLHDRSTPCVTLHGIDAAGALHTGREFCAPAAGAGLPAADPPVADRPAADSSVDVVSDESGCSLVAAGSRGFGVLALVLAGLASVVVRRRTRVGETPRS